MTTPRATQVSLADTPYYHCVARCVRRAFLCGVDEFSGQNYEHRRQWIVDKLQSLSAIFSIDICAYAVMSNHYHVVLRVDTDVANAWSEREVAERYLRGQSSSEAPANKPVKSSWNGANASPTSPGS